MTEQPPPSAEAMQAARDLCAGRVFSTGSEGYAGLLETFAHGLDRFAERVCEQRVSAETERCAKVAGAYEDHEVCEHEAGYMDGRLDAMAAILARAPADRPAPEGPQQTAAEMQREANHEFMAAKLGALDSSVPSGLASTGERPDKEEDFGKGSVLDPEHKDTQPGCGPEDHPTSDAIVDGITEIVADHFKTIGAENDLRFGAGVTVRDVVLLTVAMYIKLINRLKALPPTGRVELGERSNTESSPDTTSALSYADSREALRRIAEKTPDYRLSYTAKELQDFIAACEAPSPAAVPDYTERARRVWHNIADGNMGQAVAIIRNALSAVASEHQAAPHQSAFDLAKRARDEVAANWQASFQPEPNKIYDVNPALLAMIEQAALNAITRAASEHQAEIAALREQVNFFQVQYQDEIGLNGMREERDNAVALAKFALLARLREPDVRETVKDALVQRWLLTAHPAWKADEPYWQAIADAALTKIVEMLT